MSTFSEFFPTTPPPAPECMRCQADVQVELRLCVRGIGGGASRSSRPACVEVRLGAACARGAAQIACPLSITIGCFYISRDTGLQHCACSPIAMGAHCARIAPSKEASRRCAARPFYDVSLCLFRSFRFVVISSSPCEAVFLVQAWSRIFSKRSRLVCGVFVGRASCAIGPRRVRGCKCEFAARNGGAVCIRARLRTWIDCARYVCASLAMPTPNSRRRFDLGFFTSRFIALLCARQLPFLLNHSGIAIGASKKKSASPIATKPSSGRSRATQ